MVEHIGHIPVVGLVGGIGSGKSYLARGLEQSGMIAVVDGDLAGHEVLQRPEVKSRIAERFGKSVFDRSGAVDRRKLSQVVFGAGTAATAARTALESIVHPQIKEILAEQIAAARVRPGLLAVVLDAAIMLETGWRDNCDVVVFVDAPLEQRQARVRATRGWTAADLQSREDTQLPLSAKRQAADYVVENSGSAEAALARLEQIIRNLLPCGGSAQRVGPPESDSLPKP